MLTKILVWVSFNSGSRLMIMMKGIRGKIGTLQMHGARCFMESIRYQDIPLVINNR
jgi:hypothetical protein